MKIDLNKKTRGVEFWENKNNSFLVVQLDYFADPEKASTEWAEKVEREIGRKAFLREMCRDRTVWAGKGVYEGIFTGKTKDGRPWHLAEENIEPDKNLPLILGYDPGMYPACVVSQLWGRKWRVLQEYIGMGVGLRRFVSEILIPGLQRDFPDWAGNLKSKSNIWFFCDPWGNARSDAADGETRIQLLSEWFDPMPSEQSWEKRRTAVENYLLGAERGEPCFQSSPRCKILNKGFLGGYRYPEQDKASKQDKLRPEKSPESHPHDGLQYACLGATWKIMREFTKIKQLKYDFSGRS